MTTDQDQDSLYTLIDLLAIQHPEGMTTKDIMLNTGWSKSKLQKVWDLYLSAQWDEGKSPGMAVVVRKDGKVLRKITQDINEGLAYARTAWEASRNQLIKVNKLAEKRGWPLVLVPPPWDEFFTHD